MNHLFLAMVIFLSLLVNQASNAQDQSQIVDDPLPTFQEQLAADQKQVRAEKRELAKATAALSQYVESERPTKLSATYLGLVNALSDASHALEYSLNLLRPFEASPQTIAQNPKCHAEGFDIQELRKQSADFVRQRAEACDANKAFFSFTFNSYQKGVQVGSQQDGGCFSTRTGHRYSADAHKCWEAVYGPKAQTL